MTRFLLLHIIETMSGNTSSTGSEADFEKKAAQAPTQVLDVPARELSHKKYSLKALWHWLGDRDVHIWIMSLGEWLGGNSLDTIRQNA